MSDGYGSKQATNTWIGSDGTVTNHDPDTEMGFWIRLFHNECDRSAHLEQEIERLREVVQKLAACIDENSHAYGCLGYKFDGWCTCEVGEALKAVRGE